MVDLVVETEKEWCDYILSDDREFPGLTRDKLFSFVLFSAREVYEFFEIECTHDFPEKNPLKFMEKWIDMGKMQSSPQEEKPGNYMLGMVEHDVGEEVLDFTL
jgi:ribonucleotide reductase beta subunit family protein with ferritin-like domain